MLKTTLLFVATAFAEIIGCYLPYLWLRQNKSPWLLAPAALSLIAFAYLLTLHPTAAGYQLWAEALEKPLAEVMR